MTVPNLKQLLGTVIYLRVQLKIKKSTLKRTLIILERKIYLQLLMSNLENKSPIFLK